MTQNFLSIYAKSFNWAGFFLTKKIYQNSSNLYDFCRTLDDIADQDLELEIKKRNFKEFKNDFLNKNLRNVTIKKIYNLIENFDISKSIILDLFDGVESDLKENIKFNSNKELIIYSYRVAGTVGLMMAKILKVSSKNSLKAAIDLGIAMQLTNIARDVVEDGKRNRSYINSNFESIIKTLKLADSFYESSFKSIKEIPLSSRFGILVARRVYREIGNKILNKKNMDNYKNSGKIYVSNFGKINQTLLSIFDLIKLVFTKQGEHLRIDEHRIINEQINLNERI
ncbi:MAG: phytoene/squalene synthase family protein [Candidatus Pelagibacter sp.]